MSSGIVSARQLNRLIRNERSRATEAHVRASLLQRVAPVVIADHDPSHGVLVRECPDCGLAGAGFAMRDLEETYATPLEQEALAGPEVERGYFDNEPNSVHDDGWTTSCCEAQVIPLYDSPILSALMDRLGFNDYLFGAEPAAFAAHILADVIHRAGGKIPEHIDYQPGAGDTSGEEVDAALLKILHDDPAQMPIAVALLSVLHDVSLAWDEIASQGANITHVTFGSQYHLDPHPTLGRINPNQVLRITGVDRQKARVMAHALTEGHFAFDYSDDQPPDEAAHEDGPFMEITVRRLD